MAGESGFAKVQPWVSLVVRIGMAVTMLWAGVAKIADLPASVRAVRAYQILPEVIVPAVGNALPFIEILLGMFLLMGVFTRWLAFIYIAMVVAFVIGVIYAWVNGLQIDCGCFGGGGELDEGETAQYLPHILERAGFLAMGTWLAIFPRSALSVDGLLSHDDD